jgi:HlyD family secretion protein
VDCAYRLSTIWKPLDQQCKPKLKPYDVHQGQVLARIDPATYETILKQHQAELAYARAACDLSRIDLERKKSLRQKNVLAESELDQAVAIFTENQAQVDIKEAAVRNAQTDLARCTIYSPIEGLVISRKISVGQTVAASFNTPELFSIANDLSKMKVVAKVAEADIGAVKEGESEEFTVEAFPDRKFAGKVTQVRNSPITEDNVVHCEVVLETQNSGLRVETRNDCHRGDCHWRGARSADGRQLGFPLPAGSSRL